MLQVRRARVPVSALPTASPPVEFDPLEPAILCDISIDGGTISKVERAGNLPGAAGSQEFDAEGSLVFPAFVDAHVHLDKTHTWHRAPNRSGTFNEAIATLAADRENWTDADLRFRAGFALRTAWAHGTRAIRTHVDSALPWAETSHAAIAALREEWRGRIEVQSVPLCGGDLYGDSTGEKIADVALRYGASALGGFMQMSADLPRQLDRLLSIARERGVGIDLHVDENDRPAAECLRLVAEAVLRAQFDLPVLCGHCCSLALQPPERARSTIALVREARIGIIALPLCNLYLQDRRSAGREFPRTPRWRGITLIHDFLDAGVPVACAGDNVRDAFFAFGDYDLAEVYLQSIRLAHLDARLADSVRVVTTTPADFIGRPDLGRIAPGAAARLVVFAARRFSELLARTEARRRCIDGEQIHSTPPPDFAELAAAGF
jgi:cytosine/creatinine deaminase